MAMTFMVTVVVLDILAIGAYVFMFMQPIVVPLSHGFLSFLQAVLGPWTLSLIGSFAFEVSICICCWRVYRGLRVSGLYPFSEEALVNGNRLPRHSDVLPCEMVCEPEDARLLQDYDCCSRQDNENSDIVEAHRPVKPIVVEPFEEDFAGSKSSRLIQMMAERVPSIDGALRHLAV